MVPALTAQSRTAVLFPSDCMGFVYVPHGAIMDKVYARHHRQLQFESSLILKPLEAYRDHVVAW